MLIGKIDSSTTNNNAQVSSTGKYINNLPKTVLKDFDVYNNLSGKELFRIKKFVNFVDRIVSPLIKCLTPKSDQYTLKAINDFDELRIILEHFPAKGETEFVTVVDHQDAFFPKRLANKKKSAVNYVLRPQLKKINALVEKFKTKRANRLVKQDQTLKQNLLSK